MKKCISSVFQYKDYRVLLLDDFTQRTTNNSRYSLRAYARDLELSPGYLSSVLRGGKNLNMDNYKKIFLKIGFTKKEEIDYVEKLILHKTTKNQLLREEALNYIHNHFQSLGLKDISKHDEILNSGEHLIVYMTISCLSESKIVFKIANSFGISKNKFNSIINELVAKGYIKQHKDNLVVVNKKIAIGSSPKILNCTSELSNLLFKNIKENGGISFPYNSTHSFIMGFDEASFLQAIEVYKQFLHQIYRISQNTKSIDRITFFTDILMTKVLKTPENTL